MNGSCLCGAVRFTLHAAPSFAAKCYCADCHKESGTGHLTTLAVSDYAVEIAGETATYTSAAASGATVTRIRCRECGSTLLARSTSSPGMSVIRAGMLDVPLDIKPTVAIFGIATSEWDRPPVGMKIFDGMPLA